MSSITLGSQGEISLPGEVRDRYWIKPNTPVRILETRSGILILPLTDEPMSPELARDIADWQSLESSAWDEFAFEESDA